MFVSLVAGTPYLYGFYSPQLVQRVGLSTSDAATISVAVNIGSGLGGLPAGLLIDRAGPQISIVLGSLCIFSGYFSLNKIFNHKIGNLPIICVLMALVGFGSVTSFFAGLKAAQANFPNHRGSAGAIPVGAYGLAATLFSLIAAKFFKGDAGELLAFLAYFCGSVAFLGSWFVHVFPLATELPPDAVAVLVNMSRSRSLKGSFSFWGIGSRTPRSSVSLLLTDQRPFVEQMRLLSQALAHKDSSVSLNNANSVFIESTSAQEAEPLTHSNKSSQAPSIEATNLAPQGSIETIKFLLKNKTFLTHYVILSLLSGVCQMYIYTVGFIIRAQFNYSGLKGNPAGLQAVQVSTISLASFAGRVVSGVVSDYIYKTLRAQRQWVIVCTICLVFVSQILLIYANGIHGITVISMVIGFGYGILNGTYPAIMADEFGSDSFTTAWGLACSGPLLILFTLEKYFGYIYDSHSDENGACFEGNLCYRGAFETSSTLCILTACVTATLMYFKARS